MCLSPSCDVCCLGYSRPMSTQLLLRRFCCLADDEGRRPHPTMQIFNFNESALSPLMKAKEALDDDSTSTSMLRHHAKTRWPDCRQLSRVDPSPRKGRPFPTNSKTIQQPSHRLKSGFNVPTASDCGGNRGADRDTSKSAPTKPLARIPHK
uniref:Secreted protein n=1 Tax=Panagrellus redivivus TaxID=6233 RepID=A0A7E4VFU6_PANRE